MTYSPSFQTLYDTGVARTKQASQAAAAPITDFNDGSAADLLIGAAAAMGELVVHKLVEDYRRLFFDTAAAIPDGTDLDKLAYDRLRLVRQAATAAQVSVAFTRPTLAGGAGTVPAGTTVVSDKDPTTGSTTAFALSNDLGFSGADLTKSGTAVASVVGVSGNVAAAKINTAQTALFDPTLVVSNAQASAGGNDAETNQAFLGRCHAWGDAQRKGTLSAIEFGALAVSGVRRATAVEVGRQVTLYVGDDQGNSNSPMTAAVAAIVDNWRAGGVLVVVAGTTIDQIIVSLACVWQTGANSDSTLAAIRAALVDEINSKGYGAGDTIFRSVVQQVALDVGRPLGLLNVSASLSVSPSLPSAQDLTLALAHVPQTSAGLISFA